MKKSKPTKNRTSLISNEVLEKHRYQLSLNAQKLLYGFAQSIDHTIDMFPTIEFDINGLWEYLDIKSNRGDRYDIIADAITEIQKNPIELRQADSKKWLTVNWITTSGFDAQKSEYVHVKFNDDVKPFLLNLKGYVKIQGKYICDLNSKYSTWLYPVMKMILEKYKGKHVITLDRLKEYTYTDSSKAYNDPTFGNKNFLNRCLGISRNSKKKVWVISENSPLHEISKKTDVTVTAEVLKKGRKYDSVMFYVTSKTKKKTKEGASDDKSKYVNEIPKEFKPATRYPLKDVYQNATAAGLSVQEYCHNAGYKIEGDWVYKKFREPKKGRKRTGGNLRIDNAMGQLSLLDQTGDND